jgi:hypothetical protein
MLPILISVSLAPVSYFFWANALLDAKASAAATSRAVRNLCKNIISPSSKRNACDEMAPLPPQI